MNLDDEQLEIIRRIDSLLDAHSGYGWGHYQGDVLPRVLAHYASNHLPGSRKIVGPNVYIKDVKTEFDLMIVDSGSIPMPFSSAYPVEHIRCVIEVKRKGIFGNIDTFRKAAETIRSNFDKALGLVMERNSNCKAAYITISETVNPKKQGSHNYGNITRELLAPYPVFVLQDSRSNEIQLGEWQRFIEYVTSDV